MKAVGRLAHAHCSVVSVMLSSSLTALFRFLPVPNISNLGQCEESDLQVMLLEIWLTVGGDVYYALSLYSYTVNISILSRIKSLLITCIRQSVNFERKTRQ